MPEFESRRFEPECAGPIQSRFHSGETNSHLHFTEVPLSSLAVAEIIPGINPDDLPDPEEDFASRNLDLLMGFRDIGSISSYGLFINLTDEKGPLRGQLGQVCAGLIREMTALYSSEDGTDSQSESEYRTFMRSTPLVSAILRVGGIKHPKIKEVAASSQIPFSK